MGGVRQSNFELLRIIAMFLIIASHWGWIFLKVDIGSLPVSTRFFYTIFRSFGQVGVVLFVLISGYFMCTKKFDVMGIIKLFMQIVVLNIIALLFSFVFSKIIPNYEFNFTLENLFCMFLPLESGFWFVNAYTILFLLSPLLNIVISKLKENQFIFMLLLLIFFSSIYQSFFGNEYIIMSFILYYMLAAFVRLYPHFFKVKKGTLIFIIICFLVLYETGTFMGISPIIQENYNILLITMCLGIFVLFSKIDIGANKIINTIAGTTFGVYILHCTMFLWDKIWLDVLQQHVLINTNLFWLHAIISSLVVFVLFGFVDWLRKISIEKPMVKGFKKLFGKQIDKINLLFDKPEIIIYENEPTNHKFMLYLLQTVVTYLISAFIFKTLVGLSALISYIIFLALNLIIFIVVSMIKKSKERKKEKQAIE